MASDDFLFLFRSISDAALVVGWDDHEIIDANDAACDLLGYERRELIGLPAHALHPHELEALQSFFQRIEQVTSSRTAELACRRKSGQLVPADIQARITTRDNRKVMLAIIRNLRRDRLAEIGSGVAKIAHDLRNILASGRLLAERLENVEDPATRRIAIDLLSTVDRATEMCTTTLTAGRAREPNPQPEVVNLRLLIESIALAAGLTQPAAPDWLNDVPETLEVFADRHQLQRAIINLARNARQATPLDGLIVFTAVAKGSHAQLEITDTGPGLPLAIRDNPFASYALSSTVGGTGLGLAIARELIEKQCGTLTLINSGPEGTCFRVTLPSV